MKVGTADKLTASGAPAAREIMERKLGGEGQVIEAKGLGGKIGGADQVRITCLNKCIGMDAYLAWFLYFGIVP